MPIAVRVTKSTQRHLSVGLGNTLELVLLLDGVRVGGALRPTRLTNTVTKICTSTANVGSVDELIGKALRDGLDVAEGSLARSLSQEGNGLQQGPMRPGKGGPALQRKRKHAGSTKQQ